MLYDVTLPGPIYNYFLLLLLGVSLYCAGDTVLILILAINFCC